MKTTKIRADQPKSTSQGAWVQKSLFKGARKNEEEKEKEIGPKPNYKSPITQGPMAHQQLLFTPKPNFKAQSPSPIRIGPRKIQSPTEMGPRHIQSSIQNIAELSTCA
jgi:hypothetical protein